MNPAKSWRLVVALILFSISSLSRAGLNPPQFWCVTNAAELQNALTVAQSNDRSDVIRIAAGTYLAPSGGFVYTAGNSGGDDHSITLSGGWTPFFNNPCGQQLATSPFDTVLSGGGVNRALRVTVRSNSSVNIEMLAFLSGYIVEPGGRGGGLEVRVVPPDPYTAQIRIERNAFLGNTARFGGGLSVSIGVTGSARLTVLNNVFVSNHSTHGSGAADVLVNGGDAGLFGAGIRVVNNTVINNTTDEVAPIIGGMRVAGSTPNKYIVNNVLWGNQSGDLRVQGSSSVFRLLHNNIGLRTGNVPTSQAGNLSVEPQWEPCLLCFKWVPLTTSPMVDGGRNTDGIGSFWSLSTLDLLSQPRVHSGTVDIGAYESYERLFSDRFEMP